MLFGRNTLQVHAMIFSWLPVCRHHSMRLLRDKKHKTLPYMQNELAIILKQTLIPVTTTTRIFPKVLQYKWEAYCNKHRGRTAMQMGGVLAVFPFLQSVKAPKALQYKLEAYCNTNRRCIAILFWEVVVVGVSDVLLTIASAAQADTHVWDEADSNFSSLKELISNQQGSCGAACKLHDAIARPSGWGACTGRRQRLRKPAYPRWRRHSTRWQRRTGRLSSKKTSHPPPPTSH